MKKHKPKIIPPLFKKEKDMLDIVSHPEKLQKLKEIADAMKETQSKMVEPKTLNDWYMYVISILPKFENNDEFIKKLENLINEYTNERERSNTIESC